MLELLLAEGSGQTGVNPEQTCGCGSELGLSYSSSHVSNSCKPQERLQISVPVVVVVVASSPAALTLRKELTDHFGYAIRLWKGWKRSPTCFIFRFFKWELFFCAWWFGSSKGPTFVGRKRLLQGSSWCPTGVSPV